MTDQKVTHKLIASVVEHICYRIGGTRVNARFDAEIS
jgi:hypothetical protein